VRPCLFILRTLLFASGDAEMPYQVRKGSLIVVATTAEDALVIFDSMEKTDSEQVTIHDMDGHKVDPETIRPSSKCTKGGTYVKGGLT
jgi:hypothetical protein